MLNLSGQLIVSWHLKTSRLYVKLLCSESFSLQVDSSNVGAGAALLQKDKQGIDRMVAFFSKKKFNTYQLNYSVIEKEALALILALQNFDVYLNSGLTPLLCFVLWTTTQ